MTFAASSDAQGQAVEQAVEQARRVAARGADAVVVIDSLECLPPSVARRALAAARNVTDGGSLAVIATAPAPRRKRRDRPRRELTAMGRFPALDLLASGTTRPELLVGEADAEAIAKRAGRRRADLGGRSPPTFVTAAVGGLHREVEERLRIGLGST